MVTTGYGGHDVAGCQLMVFCEQKGVSDLYTKQPILLVLIAVQRLVPQVTVPEEL